jgi:hypothetical protein
VDDAGAPIAAPAPSTWPARHHDNHRLRLARGDQIVEDEACATDRRPGLVDIAGAVQEV